MRRLLIEGLDFKGVFGMAGLMAEMHREAVFRATSKGIWSVVAAASLYAVAAPAELLGLNSAFWGLLLFISVTAFPAGIAENRVCSTVWGALLLALVIGYTAVLRNHQAGNGGPIQEADFLQVASTFGVFVAGFVTGMIRLCEWSDERRAASRTSTSANP